MAKAKSLPTVPGNQVLAQQLKHLRLLAGYTQKQLAQKAGVSERTVCDLERPTLKTNPTLKNIRKILEVLS